MIFIKYRDTFFQHDTCYSSVFSEDFFWSPSALNLDIFFFCLFYFITGCRHFCLGFQTVHGDKLTSGTKRGPCNVDSNVSAADHHSTAIQMNRIFIQVYTA